MFKIIMERSEKKDGGAHEAISFSSQFGRCCLSLQCDPSEQNSDFVYLKSIIRRHATILEFDVGITLSTLKEDKRQYHVVRPFLTDRTLCPPPHICQEDSIERNSFKLVRWSPAGTQRFDSILLACLGLDHRLTVYKRTSKKGKLAMVADLSLVLSQLLSQRRYAHISEEPRPRLPTSASPEAQCAEFRHRVYMLAAVTMDWSGTFGPTSGLNQAEGLPLDGISEYEENSFRLLAVAMKSGHVVIWKFRVHLKSEADISLYSTFDSGYQWPVSLSWCREPAVLIAGQTTKAWLAVGDREGRISVWSLQEDSEKSIPTFDKCLDVWKDKDLMSVSNMAWTTVAPTEESPGTATLVVTKGLFLMAFLVDLGSRTVVRHTHTPDQHTVPASSMCVSGSIVLTSSTFGAVHQTVIDWTKSDRVWEMEVLEPPDANTKSSGIALSPHGIFVAKAVTARIGKRKPYPKSLNFHTLGKMDTVLARLLDCQRDLGEKTDLLEFIRQTAVNAVNGLPPELESLADGESIVEASRGREQDRSDCYTLRLRRFLLRLRLGRARGAGKDAEGENGKEGQIQQLEAGILEIERELRQLHIVKALQSWQKMSTEKVADNATSHTTALLLMADWLSTCSRSKDEPIRSLVTEAYKCNPHVTEVGKRESCDLCGEIIAFTSAIYDACLNGHRWTRCQLSLLLCQTTSKTRECVLCDGLALSAQDHSDCVWLRKVLQQCCPVCASVFVPS
ncbi:general transcription factor 3C polypeptide 4-like isoform X2 [Acanthaster planci]|uniref:General transcription factor 3C polypeptide 4-like isoform X2 n=2 Tax=Acanthaster planci TaxID=133434 RepID=A0A8B7YWB5_ACAPL|nr:general transcription factor 3C polypeptide 4-like isoform X2 [Acanthaster planci]